LKIFNLEEQVVLLEKYKINSDELLFITVILLIQEGDNSPYIQLYFSLPTACRGSIRELLVSLQDKQVITKEYKIPPSGTKFIPEDVSFNKNFIKNFYKGSFWIGKELFDSYPLSTVVNGVEYKLRRVSKKFDSLEDAYKAYGKAISWKPETHQHILELIEWGKDNNYQFTTLSDFIVDNDWLNIEAMQSNSLLDSNSIKML
jgi:hypothetical protein